MCASTVPRHLSDFLSKKESSPDMLPKPARAKKRPCGAHEMVLRGASPKECVTSHLRLKMHASGGETPKTQMNSSPSGDHCTSWMGPSLRRLTFITFLPSSGM